MSLTSSLRCAVLIAVLTVDATLPAKGQKREETSLCNIAARVDDFRGQPVTVRARIYSGGVHGWYIADEACMRFGVALFLAADVQGSEAFYKSVNFVGTFTGTFEIQKDGESPPRILRVQSMHGFSSEAIESNK